MGWRFSSSFVAAALLGGNGSNYRVVLTMQNERNALRQDQVLGVNRLGNLQILHVDFNEGRQIGRQARYFDLVHHVADDTAGELDARGDVGIDEVQRHLLVQLRG
jgi:hypothetical protein